MTPSPPRGAALRRALRRLDSLLGLDGPRRSAWVWAIPAAVFLATAGGFLVVGQITHAEPVVVVPNAVVIALVMAGLAISCMAPEADDAAPDDPPGGHDTGPVLGLPGGPWLVVAWPSSGQAEPVVDGRPQRTAATSAGSEAAPGRRMGVERN